jgi:hypothetical protein
MSVWGSLAAALGNLYSVTRPVIGIELANKAGIVAGKPDVAAPVLGQAVRPGVPGPDRRLEEHIGKAVRDVFRGPTPHSFSDPATPGVIKQPGDVGEHRICETRRRASPAASRQR